MAEKKHSIAWWIALAFVTAILTTIIYWATLNYPFQFDDLSNISRNFNLRNTAWSWHMLSRSRWLIELVNRLNFALSQNNPWGYRLFNLLVHLSNGGLIGLLWWRILKQQSDKLWLTHAEAIAALSSALFWLHPVQTQTICYVIQARLEGLACLFTLLTLHLFLTALSSKKFAWLALSIGLAIIGCGTKEIFIISPALALLIDWNWVSGNLKACLKNNWWKHAALASTIIGCFIIYLKPKFLIQLIQGNLEVYNNRGNILTNQPLDKIGSWQYFITQIPAMMHYLSIFFRSPNCLSAEYDFALANTFFCPRILLSLTALCTLLVTTSYLAYRNSKWKLPAFGLYWFMLVMLPRASIIPSPELICDYKTYMASAGLFLSIASLVIWLTSTLHNLCLSKLTTNSRLKPLFSRPASIGLTFLAMLPLSWSSYQRHKVWSTSVNFWSDVATKNPNRARAHNNLGTALTEKGEYAQAQLCFEQAVKLDKFYSDPWSNMAISLTMLNREQDAINALFQAIKLVPNQPEAYNNLAALYLKQKNYSGARACALKAIKQKPYYGKALINMGLSYLEEGNKLEALEYFQQAVKGDLEGPEGLWMLANLSSQLEKYDLAITAYHKLNQNGDHSPQLYFNLAVAYFLNEQKIEAEQIFGQLAQMYPSNKTFMNNWAESLFALERYETALPIYQSMLDLAEQMPVILTRIATCKEFLQSDSQALDWLEEQAQKFKENEPIIASITNDLARLRLQQKLHNGCGTITCGDLESAFKV